MKSYRIVIAIAASAACHAAVLLPASSYTPASAMLRRGDNAVTLELLESVEAVARPADPPPTPVTEAKQAIRREVSKAADQLAAAMEKISRIKLPEPPKAPVPEPPAPEPPPKPIVEPAIQAARLVIRRSAFELAERMQAVAATLEDATRQYAEAAARLKLAEQVAHAVKAPPPPLPPQPRKPSQGDADVNAKASEGGSGIRGVAAPARAIGALSPVYPPICRRRGEQGKVTLEWQVLASGKCGWVKVVQSSGLDLMDNAAIRAVKAAGFRPAASAGRAVASVMTCTFRFTLTDPGY